MAILKTLTVQLTRKQAEAIRAAWSECPEGKRAIIAQPAIQWGPFQIKNCTMQVAILDRETMTKIQTALNP